MARKNRLQIPGSACWVVFKGNAGTTIFRDDRDRVRLAEFVAENAEDFGVRVYAYCWLDNQGHLLLEAPRGNLSLFMRNLLTRHTTGFRIKYGISGHILQSRFDSVVVGGDGYLLKVCRHLHLLPVSQTTSGLQSVEEKQAVLDSYRWSNYRQMAGMEPTASWLANDRILPQASGGGKAAAYYRRYVKEALVKGDDDLGIQGSRLPVAIGDDAFLACVRREQIILEQMKWAGTPRSTPIQPALYENPDQVISTVCARLKTTREKLTTLHAHGSEKGIVGLALIRRCGMSHEAIARLFGMKSGAAVSCAVRKVKSAAQEDDGLKALLDEVATYSR